MSIAKNIKRIRLKQGMTQNQLAKLLNVSYQQLGAWENDRRIPNTDNQIKIAKALNVPLSAINSSYSSLEDIELQKELSLEMQLESALLLFFEKTEFDIDAEKTISRCEHILSFYKQLNDDGRELLRDFAEMLTVQDCFKGIPNGEQNK